MKALIAAAVAVAALLPLAAAGAETSHTTTRTCAPVAFTPNSDDAASRIRATGLTCGLARDFIRDSDGAPDRRFRGFRCRSTGVDDAALPYRRYRCTGAGDVIRWRRY